MKEPITGRDLVVISTICTGFGALLSWGFFYRWGSSPPVKPVDLSAWIQAIGSVIAIFAAVRIAGWQEYRREATRSAEQAAIAQAFASLLLPATEKYASVISNTKSQIPPTRLSGYYSFEARIPIVPKALVDEVPRLHHLGEAGSLLLRAIHRTGEIEKLYDHNRGFKYSDLETLREHWELAAMHSASALKKMQELLL